MKNFIIAFSLLLCSNLYAASPMRWGIKVVGLTSNSSLSIKDFSPSLNLGSRIGFGIGVVNNISLARNFSLQSEIMYINDGLKLSIGKSLISNVINSTDEDERPENYVPRDLSINLSRNSICIPVLIKYETKEGLCFMIGPYLSYRMSLSLGTKNIVNTLDEDDRESFGIIENVAEDALKNNLSSLDYGISLGTEYSLKNLFFDIRYSLSLNNGLKNKIDLSSFGVDEKTKREVNNVKDIIKPNLRNHSLQIGIGYRF